MKKKYVFNSKTLGEVELEIKKKKKIEKCYYIEAIYMNRIVSALTDNKYNEIIPFSFKKLDNFFTGLNNNICISFNYKETPNTEYYHVQLINNKYTVVLVTNVEDEIPLSIEECRENGNYWFLKANKDINEYAIYDYQNKNILTNFFDDLRVLEYYERGNHSIYFSKNIYSDDESSKKTILTSVCGFLDEEGNFSSQIFDTESSLLYNSYQLGKNTLSDNFVFFLNDLERTYRLEYEEKEAMANEIISYLYQNENMSDKPLNYNNKAKIISINSRKKV